MSIPIKMILLLCWCAFCLGSCSSDEDKYLSEPPIFSDFSIKNLTDGSDVVRAGQPFVVTAEQRKQGKKLYHAKYTWSANNAEDWSHKYTHGVVYDKQPIHPTDTIIAPNPGRYKLTLTAEYNPSGIVRAQSGSYNLTSGDGTVSVSAAAVKIRVVISKSIRVQ